MKRLLSIAILTAIALTGCARSYSLYDIKAMNDYELCATYKRHMHNKIQKQLFVNEVNHRARINGEEWREKCSIRATNKVVYKEDI